ncbi:hypothetical protein C8J56DRAFT_903352 [Mycena floridula]|nr:hypothetical protein C8J56DRAFT_903352 [Mycena floridula]
MKLDGGLASASAAASIFLPPKVVAVVTILFALVVTLIGQYLANTTLYTYKSLDALQLLKEDIDKITQDTVAGSIALNAQFLNEVNELRYQASKKEGQALLKKIKTHGEQENLQRLDWREMAGLRERNI